MRSQNIESKGTGEGNNILWLKFNFCQVYHYPGEIFPRKIFHRKELEVKILHSKDLREKILSPFGTLHFQGGKLTTQISIRISVRPASVRSRVALQRLLRNSCVLFAVEQEQRKSSAEGTQELSPALQRWVRWEMSPSPVETGRVFVTASSGPRAANPLETSWLQRLCGSVDMHA